MTAYYNEIDPYAAQWLRNLIDAGHIARGDVDERNIVDVRADDLRGYTQCHFFAGVGGWPFALRLAGWPDDQPVWTGSCPCQPYSEAGKRLGADDGRHLWPDWFRLIRERRPSIVFGEQVPEAIKLGWLDEVSSDFQSVRYAIGSAVLSACLVTTASRRSGLQSRDDRAYCPIGPLMPYFVMIGPIARVMSSARAILPGDGETDDRFSTGRDDGQRIASGSVAGRLTIERIAGKDFTTLAAIARMRELCRVEQRPAPVAPAPAKARRRNNRASRLGHPRRRSSEALALARASLQRLKKPSPTTSSRNPNVPDQQP
jgi:hypothetical protein